MLYWRLCYEYKNCSFLIQMNSAYFSGLNAVISDWSLLFFSFWGQIESVSELNASLRASGKAWDGSLNNCCFTDDVLTLQNLLAYQCAVLHSVVLLIYKTAKKYFSLRSYGLLSPVPIPFGYFAAWVQYLFCKTSTNLRFVKLLAVMTKCSSPACNIDQQLSFFHHFEWKVTNQDIHYLKSETQVS